MGRALSIPFSRAILSATGHAAREILRNNKENKKIKKRI
jgi:hypothetical protein